MSKPREWTLWHGEDRIVGKGDVYPGELIHVREVLPGSISITREELAQAVSKAYIESIGVTEMWESIQKSLFGEDK